MTSHWYPTTYGELEAPARGEPGGAFAGLLQRAFGGAAAAAGVAEAVAAYAQGVRDPNRLTDVIFFARHRERGNRPIGPAETQLANEWRRIRDSVVAPALRRLGPVPAPPVLPAPAPVTGPSPFVLPPDPGQLRPPARTNIRAMPLNGGRVFDVETQLIRDVASRPDGWVYLANWYARVHYYPWPSLPTFAQALYECATKGGSIRAIFWDGSLTQETPIIRSLLGPVLGRLDFVVDPIREYLMKEADTNHAGNSATAAFINTLPRAIARLDDQTQLFGSHHQKIFVVGNNETTVAVVGGVDLNPNRIMPPVAGDPGTPLFDISVQLDGGAATDIAELFERRWRALPNAPMFPLPMPPRRPPTTPRPSGGATVQLGPNFGCGKPLRDIPHAIRSGGALIANALRNCRTFFYAEDQYGVGNTELRDAIRRAFANGAAYGVVVLSGTSITHDLPEIAFRRHQFWSQFGRLVGTKLFVFDRLGDDSSDAGPHAYVHSKLLIVDDRAATIGSLNMNRRSWYNDSELAVLITDAPDLIRDMRVGIWSEHLKGISSWDDIRDPMSALTVWRACYAKTHPLPRIKPISFTSVPPRDPPSWVTTAATVSGIAPEAIMETVYTRIYDPTGPAFCR